MPPRETSSTSVTSNGENRFCRKVTQHSVYRFFRTGRTDSAAKQHNTLCTGFSEWGEQILQQSNTTRCVQVSQNGENRFCSKATRHSVYWILGMERTDSAAKQHNTLCTGFSERGEQILKQSNTALCVQVFQNGEKRF